MRTATRTLKGDAGTGILNKLDGNVNANPNVSDETKENASKADEGVDVDGKPADTIGKPADQAFRRKRQRFRLQYWKLRRFRQARARLPTSIRGNSTPRRSGCPTW